MLIQYYISLHIYADTISVAELLSHANSNRNSACCSVFWTEEQWEKDLEAELKDYEVVDEGGTSGAGGGGARRKGKKPTEEEIQAEEDEPTISNLRTRSTNNDWEEYADLIEDTDDLK